MSTNNTDNTPNTPQKRFKRPNRSKGALRAARFRAKYAKTHGITPERAANDATRLKTQGKPRWTPEEDAAILWADTTASRAELAKLTGRSLFAVAHRRRVLRKLAKTVH